jgi:H2-forming N5,N10-methylenetetrahydromethanopterin dehydrogenase-like enzyme
VDPRDRLLSAGKRMSDPVESVAQRVAERAIDLIVSALDVNALVRRVDANAVLNQVDVNTALSRVDIPALVDRVDVARLVERVDIDELVGQLDVDALLDRVDVNALVQRIDLDALVERTDLGAILAGSSGGIASEALDAARSQVVGLDQFIDRWVWRLLRPRRRPRPVVPPALRGSRPQP